MIYDLDDNPLSTAALSVEAGESTSLTVKIDCEPGESLRADVVGDLLVEAKQEDQPSFTDIEAGPLNLAPWAGARERFVIRLTGGLVTEVTERAFRIKVGL